MSENIHSEKNFNPEQYEVVDYLDNKRPIYTGQPVKVFEEQVARWEEDIAFHFPGWRSGGDNIHKCAHCGNTMVRWISVVKHLPTGKKIVFGADCTFRLDFPNRQAFKLAQLKSRAELAHARLKVYNLRTQFLADHKDLAAALETLDAPVHAGNTFAHDIAHKLNQYGTLSPRQVECFISTLARDIERQTMQAQREAQKAVLVASGVKGPVGRLEVSGKVLSVQLRDSQWGSSLKWLVELTTGAKVWSTVPATAAGGSDWKLLKGKTVKFTATFEQSEDDALFSFGSRPTKVSVLD